VKGGIYIAFDYAITWVESGAPRAVWESVASSQDGSKLVAAQRQVIVADYTIAAKVYRSTDHGTSWKEVAGAGLATGGLLPRHLMVVHSQTLGPPILRVPALPWCQQILEKLSFDP